MKRSKELPEGGGEPDLNSIITQLRCAVKAASGRGRIRRNEAAKEIWAHEYGKLTRDRGGLYGAFCARAEAHVLRLSLLYALLDSSGSIRPEHLQAALAVWEYCERSVAQVFRGVTSDLQGQKILDALITRADDRQRTSPDIQQQQSYRLDCCKNDGPRASRESHRNIQNRNPKRGSFSMGIEWPMTSVVFRNFERIFRTDRSNVSSSFVHSYIRNLNVVVKIKDLASQSVQRTTWLRIYE